MPDSEPWPRISIVTPSYSQGEFIEETIRSVLAQPYPNLEYVIIDGGSADGTVDIIRKYDDKLAYWVSEEDRGQANAINKGFERAKGDIFGWINSEIFTNLGCLKPLQGPLSNMRTLPWSTAMSTKQTEMVMLYKRYSRFLDMRVL